MRIGARMHDTVSRRYDPQIVRSTSKIAKVPASSSDITLPVRHHSATNSLHSLRSAIIGSTLAARRAGINDATKAVRTSSAVAIVSITGSHGLTPNS